MDMTLVPMTAEDLCSYKADMQEAFQLGAAEGGFPTDEQILPEADIDRSLTSPGALAYKAVLDGHMAGGAIVVLDPETNCGHLDFLYVKHGIQSRGLGRFIWFELERLHPNITVWETCTPYFEKRNIHFYINVCGFHAVEFFHAHHPDPHEPEGIPEDDDGMFLFRKVLAP